MDTTLITAGIACIIAAIVGGGLKTFALEVRVLDSGRRQAALAAFGVLLLAVGLRLNAVVPAVGGSPNSAGTADPAATRVALPATAPSPGQRPISTDECRLWFGDPPPDRVTVVESGADVELVALDKPKDRPFVVVVTEDGKPVGAVALRFYEGNSLFKITRVVNSSCEPLDTFRNESRGGDRRVLQNFDTVELTFGTLKYTLRIGYGSGAVGGQVNRV